MQGHHGHLSAEQKRLAFRLRVQGWRLIDIGKEIGCTGPMVGLMVRGGKHLEGKSFGWEPRLGCLTIADREQILLGISRNLALSAIARSIRRTPSTVTREVNANGGRSCYSAWHAHERAREQARRPKPCKLHQGRLLRKVTRGLESLWSPEEISRRLPLDFPDDLEMRVSHETIYQSLYVQGRGELRRELARCLRSGRTVGRSQGRTDGRGRIPGMVMISQRPAEVEDRAVPGHWEGDLVLGTNGTQRCRDTRGTNDTSVATPRSWRRSIRSQCRCSDARCSGDAAKRTGPVDHVGSRSRDGKACKLHHRYRHPGLLL